MRKSGLSSVWEAGREMDNDRLHECAYLSFPSLWERVWSPAPADLCASPPLRLERTGKAAAAAAEWPACFRPGFPFPHPMKRSVLKSLGILLSGVVPGCAIGRPTWWSGGAGEESGRLPNAAVRSVSEVRNGGGQAGSDGKAGTGKPGRERMEKLAASFRQKSRPGSETAEVMDMAMEAAALSAEEFEPLLELLMRDDPVGDPDQADIHRRTAELLAVRWAMVEPEAEWQGTQAGWKEGNFWLQGLRAGWNVEYPPKFPVCTSS